MLAAAAHGAPQCADCHAKQAAAHAKSNHARTLRPVVETEFGRALPEGPIGEARGGFLLTYARRGGGLEVTAEKGNQRARAQIDWAIGAGDQGVTPLAFLDGHWLEHRISFYTKPGRFDLTLGHRPGASASASAAIGIAQPESTLRACLGCHSTLGAGVTVVKAGVDCERCHGGPHPSKVTPVKQMEICGTCHRLTPPGGDEKDPLNIRLQPLRLAKSKCFLTGHVACSTCHPAHENARRADAAFYEVRCVECHAKPHRKDGCLECHMPKSTPAPYLTFTDHYIRK